MDFWGWVILIFVFFGILYSFGVFDSDMDVDDWRRFGSFLLKVILFIPIIVAGMLLHVAGDFKNHKSGYIALFLLFAFLAFGFYMGFKAGPAGPGPWQ